MAAAPRPLIAGNWKMNGLARPATAEARRLVGRMKSLGRGGPQVTICPPASLLAPLRALFGRGPVALGGQDCHAAASGAHTGDLSAEMLRDAGCRFVIVGHSERRADHGETSATVEAKAAAAHRAGLIAIVCIGETLAERQAGSTLKAVGAQLRRSVPKAATAANTVIAYEPVWAIGSGLTPSFSDIAAVHRALRLRLRRRFGDDGTKFRLLYGGSVKAANAAEILAIENVNGALVGGASLKTADFWPIVEAA